MPDRVVVSVIIVKAYPNQIAKTSILPGLGDVLDIAQKAVLKPGQNPGNNRKQDSCQHIAN